MARLSALQTYQRDLYIKSAAIKGFGATRTLEGLKSVGLGMRKTDMLKAYRNYAGIPERAELVKYVRKDYIPSARLFTQQSGYMTRNYRYTIEYQTIDDVTGSVTLKHTRLITDTPRTIQQIEDEANEIMAEQDYWGGITAISFRIAELEVRA